MGMIIQLLVSGLAVFISAYILPGVQVDSFITALFVAIVLGVVNMVIKPIVMIFTLPLNVITLGLFTFVVNAVMILLVTVVVKGFVVNGFWSALLFSLVLSVVSWFLNRLTK